MTLVLLALAAALVLALVLRGRPSTFGRPPVRRPGLLLLALIALLTSSLAKSTGIYVAWLATAILALLWFGLLNRKRPGIGLAILGIAANVVVIVLNSGMPVSVTALERAGVPADRVPLDAEAWAESRPAGDPLREELTRQTVAPWLGEAIPLALPLRPAVASAGDVLVAAGAALFVFSGLTGYGRSVPEKKLTPRERREEKRRKKAAERADAVAAGTAPPSPVEERASRVIAARDESEDAREPDQRVVPALTPAAPSGAHRPATADRPPPAHDTSGGPSAVGGPDGSDGSDPGGSDRSDGSDSSGDSDSSGGGRSAEAKQAAAERRRLKRQRKQQRKKERAAAAMQGANTGPGGDPADQD